MSKVTKNPPLRPGNRTEVLELADLCLERRNKARARYIAGGDPDDWQAAQTLENDRRLLLAEMSHLGVNVMLET